MLYYIKVETKRLIAIFFSKGQKHHLWPAEHTLLKDQLQEAERFKPLHFGSRGEGGMERERYYYLILILINVFDLNVVQVKWNFNLYVKEKNEEKTRQSCSSFQLIMISNRKKNKGLTLPPLPSSSSAEINTLSPNPFSWSWTTLPSALLPTFTNFLQWRDEFNLFCVSPALVNVYPKIKITEQPFHGKRTCCQLTNSDTVNTPIYRG